MSDRLRIEEIRVEDTYGTKMAKFALKSAVLVRGANGTGKSSILRSLAYVFSGGTDPSVIRTWRCDSGSHFDSAASAEWRENSSCPVCGGEGMIQADRSVVWFRLSDGTTVEKITRKKRGRKGSTEPQGYTQITEVIQPDGTIRPAPMEYLAELAGSMVDPSQILRIDANVVPGRKALGELLLRLRPVWFAPDELAEAGRYLAPEDGLGRESFTMPPPGSQQAIAIPPKPIGLDELRKLRGLVEDSRRAAGRTRDDCMGAIARIRKSLPDDSESRDFAGELATAQAFQRTVEQAQREAADRAKEDLAKQLVAAKEGYTLRLREIDADIDARIKVLETERTARTVEAMDIKAAAETVAREKHTADLAALEAESDPVLQSAIADVGAAKERHEANLRADGLRQELGVQSDAQADAGWKYDQLSKVLEKLDALRASKLKDLPVDGLEVYPDRVLVNGVEWQNINLASRVQASLQIAAAGSGRLQFLILDDFEHCDKETQRLLMEGLIAADFQLLVAQVAEGDLSITPYSG